jgi:hypothetical protein
MAFICCRRKYWRCASDISCCACDSILPLSSSSETSRGQRRGDGLQFLDEVGLLEDVLLVERTQVEQRAQDVGQPQRVLDVHDQRSQLLRQARGQRQRLVDEFLDAADVGIDVERAFVLLGERRDLREHRGARARDAVQPDAGQSLEDDVHARSGLRHLTDDGHRADLANVVRPGILGVVVLKGQQDQAVAAERPVHRFEGHGAVHRQRLQRQRERHRLPQGQDRKFRRKWGSRVGHAEAIQTVYQARARRKPGKRYWTTSETCRRWWYATGRG